MHLFLFAFDCFRTCFSVLVTLAELSSCCWCTAQVQAVTGRVVALPSGSTAVASSNVAFVISAAVRAPYTAYAPYIPLSILPTHSTVQVKRSGGSIAPQAVATIVCTHTEALLQAAASAVCAQSICTIACCDVSLPFAFLSGGCCPSPCTLCCERFRQFPFH